MEKIKLKTKKRIIYTVLTTLLFATGVFFDVFSIATRGIDMYEDYQVTTSMNKVENFQKDGDLTKEIAKLSKQKQKLETKQAKFHNAMIILEKKLQNLEELNGTFKLGNTDLNKSSGQKLLKKVQERYQNLTKMISFVDTILLSKQEQLRKTNAIHDKLEEDGLEVQIQKLEIEKLQQEISELQTQVENKRNYINQKAQDINNENNVEEVNIDSVILEINNQ